MVTQVGLNLWSQQTQAQGQSRTLGMSGAVPRTLGTGTLLQLTEGTERPGV